MTTPIFAERTRISSILRELMQGHGVHEEDKSVPVTSSLVTGKPPGNAPDPFSTLEDRVADLAARLGHDVEAAQMYARITRKDLLIESTKLAMGNPVDDYRRLFE